MDVETGYFHQSYYGNTTVHPIGLAVLLLCGVATFMLPRRYAMWPMLVVACFISPAQRIVLAGVDFGFLRIAAMFVLARVMLRGETGQFRWIRLDTIMALWAAGHVILPIFRSGTLEIVSKLGFSGDAIVMYFACRLLLQTMDDLRSLIVGIALVSIPTAVAFLIEMSTARNLFAVLGGVPEITKERDGKLRCQGAFAHPLIAGCFWAALLPLLVAELWQKKPRRVLAVVGIVCALVIILATSSSTPISAVMIAIIGFAAFMMRRYMRLVRWSILGLVIVLHMVMIAPVWHLIARINIVGGNSSYHRFQLIDGAINYFHEWWLVGSSVGTEHWGWMTFDMCNYYIVQGLHGGLLLLAIFVWMMAESFRACGQAVKRWDADTGYRMMAWMAGVCMLVHITNFIGVSYFGQLPMVLFLNLAVAGCLVQAQSAPLPVQVVKKVHRAMPLVRRRPAAI